MFNKPVLNVLEHTQTVNGLALVHNRYVILYNIHRLYIDWHVVPFLVIWCTSFKERYGLKEYPQVKLYYLKGKQDGWLKDLENIFFYNYRYAILLKVYTNA